MPKKPKLETGPFIHAERKPRKSEQNDEGEVYEWVGTFYMKVAASKLKRWSIWAPIPRPKKPTKAMVKKTLKMVELEDG